MDNVSNMDEHREQEQVKIPDVSTEMHIMTSKIRFLEAATMALSGDNSNDSAYYMAGLSNILEEIGDEAQEMFNKLYG